MIDMALWDFRFYLVPIEWIEKHHPEQPEILPPYAPYDENKPLHDDEREEDFVYKHHQEIYDALQHLIKSMQVYEAFDGWNGKVYRLDGNDDTSIEFGRDFSDIFISLDVRKPDIGLLNTLIGFACHHGLVLVIEGKPYYGADLTAIIKLMMETKQFRATMNPDLIPELFMPKH